MGSVLRRFAAQCTGGGADTAGQFATAVCATRHEKAAFSALDRHGALVAKRQSREVTLCKFRSERD
jgi:hypothetical protein